MYNPPTGTFRANVISSIVLASLLLIFAGCVTTATTPSTETTVGPPTSSELDQALSASEQQVVGVDIVVPLFDPGLPYPDEYAQKDKGVWPELRRAESVRFAYKMRQALSAKRAFHAVRVVPNVEAMYDKEKAVENMYAATGELYLQGRIVQSDGEKIALDMSLYDITGHHYFSKTFQHTVDENFFESPRNTNQDPYAPIFKDVAEEVTKIVHRKKPSEIKDLQRITELRFAQSLSDEAFASYLQRGHKGYQLVSFPNESDPMLQRVRDTRIKDQLFFDDLDSSYATFSARMEQNYRKWQEFNFHNVREARKAESKALFKGIGGAILTVGGALLALDGVSKGDTSTTLLGAGTTVAGTKVLSSARDSAKEAKAYREAIAEVSKSIELELAPRVMTLEGETIELTGSAKEQARRWREFLRQIYAEERVPDEYRQL